MPSNPTSKKRKPPAQVRMEAWSLAGAVFAELLDIFAQSKLPVAYVAVIWKSGDMAVYRPERLSKTSGFCVLPFDGVEEELGPLSGSPRPRRPKTATSRGKSAKRS